MTKPERELYEAVGSLAFDQLQPATVEAVTGLVLDHFACAILGRLMPWTRALERVVLPSAGSPTEGAQVYGRSQPVAPATAALINGTAGHGFDLDDLYFPAMTHPGCVVIPAAVAAGAEADVDGRRLLAAIVAGYEVMCRTGVATGLGAGERGFHLTGLHGATGAATAATALGDHDPDLIASAVGVASSLGAGIKAFTNKPGMVKRMHAGRAAEAGVLVSGLVRHGFAGPGNSLTGQFGLVHVFGHDEADVEALSRGLGQHWAVDEIYLKPYAACGALHGAVTAADELSAEISDPSRIDSIVVGTSKRVLDQNADRDPHDAMSVQYSMEACVALGLLGHARDALSVVAYADDPNHPARKIADKVRIEFDSTAEEAYPDPNISRVDVRFADGSVASMYGRSDPTTSRGWNVALAKLYDLTATALPEPAREQLAAATRALAAGGSVRDCLAALQAMATK